MEIIKEFIEYFVIAFVASAVLIFIAKIVMNKMIRRDKMYYEGTEQHEEDRMLLAVGITLDRENDGKEGK